MKLNTKGRYAVMAMIDLGLYSQNQQPVPLADIAGRQEISLSYLEQLFAQLRREGLVKSVRGPGGGYVLARPAAATSIADIVLAVDESLRVTRCGGGGAAGCMTDKSHCLTHDLWEELGNQIRGYLGRVTIADVLARRTLPAPVLRVVAE